MALIPDLQELNWQDQNSRYQRAVFNYSKVGTIFRPFGNEIQLNPLFNSAFFLFRSFSVKSTLPEDVFNGLFGNGPIEMQIKGLDQVTQLKNSQFYIDGANDNKPMYLGFASSQSQNENRIEVFLKNADLLETVQSSNLDITDFKMFLNFEIYKVNNAEWIKKYAEQGSYIKGVR